VIQSIKTGWESSTIIDSADDDAFDSAVTCAEVTYDVGFDDDNDVDDLSFIVSGYRTIGTTSGPSSSSSSCFAATETVQLENGSIVAIADVAVGDRVLAADAAGSPTIANVVAVPHDAKNTIRAEFVQLVTASGDIKLTNDHLITVSKGCETGVKTQLSVAKDVVVGDCLLTVSGALDTVESIKFVQGTGVHTVVTDAEFVVVNGFVASPFAHNHAVANAYYNIIRFVSKIIPANYFVDYKLFKDVNAFLGTLISDFSA
jgi:hypothetical protein